MEKGKIYQLGYADIFELYKNVLQRTSADAEVKDSHIQKLRKVRAEKYSAPERAPKRLSARCGAHFVENFARMKVL